MLRASWTVRLLICIAGISIIGGRVVAQQGLKAPADGSASTERCGPPPSLKLSSAAKEWFDPKARPPVAVGKRSIDVLEDDATTDDDLVALRYLPEVSGLSLERCFTAAGLAKLNGLRNIESLRLESAIQMTDEELEGLATMPNLRELRIVQEGSSLLSDRGLRALSRLPHLQVLELTNANISEEGVRSLNDFPDLPQIQVDERDDDLGLAPAVSEAGQTSDTHQIVDAAEGWGDADAGEGEID